MTQQELGRLGEEYASHFLLEKGYKIVARNFRFKQLEADIICEFKKKLIVVEVKTRKSLIVGEPWRAVTIPKQKQIIKVANHYILEKNIHLEVQFDIISIILNEFRKEIEHIEDAFTA